MNAPLNILLIGLTCLFINPLFGQINFDKQAYKLYNKKGVEVTYNELYNACLSNDIVLFGELHNNAIAHWLQLELALDLQADTNNALILGAEMFEAHQQLLIDEYLAGLMKFKTLNQETKLWKNTKTDYLPLLNVAKDNELSFVASNVPRILARQVAQMGLDSFYTTLNDSIKRYLPPTPITVDLFAPGYKELMEMDFGANHGMNTKQMVEAQAIKDATMAWWILQNYREGSLFLHFQGDFHSKNYGGIYWYLNHYDKKKKVLTISTVESETLDFDNEWKKQADFILVIPERMTKTY